MGESHGHQIPVPICSLGLIADVQYADAANGTNFLKTRIRYYRSSLELVQRAVGAWQREERPITCILQLGDVIDGLNRQQGQSQEALDKVLLEFINCGVPIHHVIGNHELYNFLRPKLLRTPLNSSQICLEEHVIPEKPSDAFYYHFAPTNGFRVVVLDTYEISLLGESEENKSSSTVEASQILRQRNPNMDLNSSLGLYGMESRFLKYNGAASKRQLDWLDLVLQSAAATEEKVLVAAHNPVLPGSTACESLCWNCEEILSTLQRHDCVVMYVCGHDHDGGYTWDAHGICHVSLPAVLETPPEETCHGVLDVYEDRLELRGSGRVPSLTAAFSK